MSKIDTSIWMTQQALADELNTPVQNVHNWVQRGKIKWQLLPNSSMKLVNKNTINVNDLHYKRAK